MYEAASDDEIQEFWSVLLLIDATLTRDDTTKKQVAKIPALTGWHNQKQVAKKLDTIHFK